MADSGSGPKGLHGAQIDLFKRSSARAEPTPKPANLAAPTPSLPPLPERARAAVEPARARIHTVSELTRELKGTLEGRFFQVAVRGEISNFRPAASGHVYFTLKDEGACLAAVLFRAEATRLKFKLKDGLSVVLRGRLSVYEARGQYQLICESVEPEGAGALALAFEQLKQKLSAEGLFDPERKRPIPFLAKRIGVVTSPTGAALRDFLRVLNDRFPIPVLLAPARVQGEGAAAEIARGIERLAESGLVDVIVVTRGGGSIEDLWAFNEEAVARAVASCPVPVVSAVGHEVDFTICDFVADRRCATPTDAAKTLAPSREDLARQLDKHRRHLGQLALRLVSLRRERLQLRARQLGDPRRAIAEERLALDDWADRAQQALRQALATRREALYRLSERLARAHPRTRLNRLGKELSACDQAMAAAMRRRLAGERQQLRELSERLRAASPAPLLSRGQGALALKREACEKALRRALAEQRVRLSKAAARLESLSPLAVLARGYSVVFGPDGRAVVRAEQAPPGSDVRLLLADRSELTARVNGRRAPDR